MQSLRLRLIAPFVAGTVLLTLILAGYTYISGRKAVENATILIAEAQASQTLSSMRVLFRMLNTSMYNMIADRHIHDLFIPPRSQNLVDKTMDWLNILTRRNEYYRDIFIVDTEGICIASSNPGHLGVSFINENYVQQALRGRFTYGDPNVGKVTLRFSAAVAGPINVNNKIVGALIVQNDFPQIVEFSKRSDMNKKIIMTSMLEPNGVFEAHYAKSLMGNKKRAFPALYEKLRTVALRGGIVRYTVDGEKYLGYAKLESFTKWIIISSGKERDIFAQTFETGFVVFGISCFFLLLITCIVVRFANGVLSSLLSLITYAKQVSEGDLQLELGATTRRDELGTLHISLQKLVTFLREMLVETQKASKMKGQFLANMSHEIRTPLNAIIGIAHLIVREGNLSPRIHDFTKKIQLSAHSLLGLINDILDISKVEAGMLDLEVIPFNLREVVDNALLIQQESAKGKGIELTLSYPDNMPTHYLGDPLRIGQILNNLLGNSLKFTKSGSVGIECSLGSVPDSYIPDFKAIGSPPFGSLCVHICVKDTGIGMSQSVIASVFTPFMQADTSITRQFGGTGLGLPISQHFVKLLHGAFSIVSTLGEGTRFMFFMQLALAEEIHNEGMADLDLETAFASLQLSGKTILVAEDNMINQMIMEELLSPTCATVVIANNGQEAVDYLRENQADIVFMDLQMPLLDGFEATVAIRKFKDAATLPIVAVTANAMKEDKEKGFVAGMDSYITKPIDPKQLLTVLRLYCKK